MQLKDRIVKVEERFVKQHVCGLGKEAVFADRSVGWWLILESGIALRIRDPSEFVGCELVRITVEASHELDI